MSDSDAHTAVVAAVSHAMVSLHKEQFGRGPVNARTHFAGPDMLVCTLEGALLPAEHALVEMGEQQRVREARLHYQVATGPVFIRAVEELVNRTVRSFAIAVDPDHDVLFEVFTFEPCDPAANCETGCVVPTSSR